MRAFRRESPLIACGADKDRRVNGCLAGGCSRTRAGSKREYVAEIRNRLSKRGAKVVMLENDMSRGLPHQADGQHLTPVGLSYILARELLLAVIAALGQ
jgi:acyl-CoA thioesterase I